MKRLEKQRAKAERRAQKKLANRTPTEAPVEDIGYAAPEALGSDLAAPTESEPHN